MRAEKPKQKDAASASEKPKTAMPPVVYETKTFLDRVMRKLFGLQENWYQQRDIVKNNMVLGKKYLQRAKANDAILRFKIATWFSPAYADAWAGLGRAYLMAGKRPQAVAALTKAHAHEGAKALLAAIPKVLDAKKPAISVQPVGIDAANLLAKLHEESFPTHWNEKSFNDMLMVAGTHAWIAGLPGFPMGAIVGRALSEQYEILTIAVNPEWRGRGIARVMFEALVANAKETGAKELFLEVATDNEAACEFYQKAGFATISERKDYYRHPDGSFSDALVMRRELA